MKSVAARTVVLASALLAGEKASGQASLTGVGEIPGGAMSSEPIAVSADGTTVVGYSAYTEDQHGPVNQAFLWTRESGLSPLGLLVDGHMSFATSLSADGRVVVGWGDTTDTNFEAFRWTPESGLQGLGSIFYDEYGGFWSEATGVSADGSLIVGWLATGHNHFASFAWTDADGMERLPRLGESSTWFAQALSADGRVAVGAVWNGTRSAGVRWSEDDGFQELEDLPGGQEAGVATAVSADGSVIVGYSSSDKPDQNFSEAARWTADGSVLALGDFPGGQFGSYAWAVSADGSVIVGAGFGAEGGRAFIWTEAEGMRSVKEVLLERGATEAAEWQLTDATGVSADGKVLVGRGINPCGESEGWVARLDDEQSIRCFANCDQGCPSNNELDLFDFYCFFGEFADGNLHADCDLNGVLDLFDFVCFTNAFNAGC